MIDYHTHLVPHGEARRFSAADVAEYARRAADAGLTEIAVTEHFYRFPDVQDAIGPWWEADPDANLASAMATYFQSERLEQTMDEYVDVVLSVREESGVAVRLGLEVDLFAGRMAQVAELLAGHPWDVLLGSVHWLGAWEFDALGVPAFGAEWDQRDPDDVWRAYVDGVEEIASSGVCDVLAHVDLAKIGGVRPVTAASEVEERLVKAAAEHGLAVEINTNGWNKRVGEAYPSLELLRAFRAADVGLTLASDAHQPERVAERFDDAHALARDAGYDRLTTFVLRRSQTIALDGGD